MKIHIRTKAALLGATLFGITLFLGATAPAATYTQTVNEFNPGNDWYGVIWSSGAAATGGNDYITGTLFGTNCGLRTVNVNSFTNMFFNGDHLILTNGGGLFMKHAGAMITANLILDGGMIVFRGGNGSGSSGVAGTLQVNPNPNNAGLLPSTSGAQFYNLGQDQTGGSARNILLSANLSGSGNLIVNMNTAAGTGGNNIVQVAGTNTAFSGNWTNSRSTLQIVSGSADPLGSGAVVLSTVDSALQFNSTNDLVINNPISGVGPLIKSNTNTVTVNADSHTGSTTISGGVLKIGASSSLTNSRLIAMAGGTLDVNLIGGLDMGSAGSQQMSNCNGNVTGNLTASTANTLNFALTPTTNDILNVTGSLTLNGNPTLSLTLSGFKTSGTYRLINYSGTIQGGGSFTLVPPAGSSESFLLDTNTPGQVNLTVVGSQQNLIWVGDGVANNWDTTTPNWTGDSNIFSLGCKVVFDDSGSATPDINVTGTSFFPNSMTVSNNSQSYTFYGSGISTSGSLIKRGTNDLVFINGGGNAFNGPITIQAGVLSIGNGLPLGGTLGTGTITNNGVLRVNMSQPAVAFNAPIRGSGSLEIMGGGAVVTIGGNGHNSYSGLTTIGNGCQLNIATSDALGSTSSGTIVGANGRLGVVSFVGSMTVAEPVTINGTGIDAPTGPFGALYVADPGNIVTWGGPVTVASDSTIRGVNNSRMNFSNTVIGNDVALNCTAGNPNVLGGSDTSTIIFFQNNLSLGSAGSLVVDGVGTVVLESNTNVWGNGTTIARGTLRVSGKLDGGTVTVDGGTNSATLSGAGTILGPVTTLANGILAPGNFSAIGTLTVSNTVTLSGTTEMELNRTSSPNSDRLVANSISFGGTLNVVNSGSALQANDTFILFSGPIDVTTFAVTNLPALSSPLSWDLSLLQSQGTIKVSSTVAPAPTNSLSHVDGTNFVFQTAPSQSGFSYVLQSTPALNPPIVWSDIRTNAGTGAPLNFTNPITPGAPRQFFRIQVR
jgi:fibronectin-binding autotransporter adhesin